jgi:hypothetical protein
MISDRDERTILRNLRFAFVMLCIAIVGQVFLIGRTLGWW